MRISTPRTSARRAVKRQLRGDLVRTQANPDTSAPNAGIRPRARAGSRYHKSRGGVLYLEYPPAFLYLRGSVWRIGACVVRVLCCARDDRDAHVVYVARDGESSERSACGEDGVGPGACVGSRTGSGCRARTEHHGISPGM